MDLILAAFHPPVICIEPLVLPLAYNACRQVARLNKDTSVFRLLLKHAKTQTNKITQTSAAPYTEPLTHRKGISIWSHIQPYLTISES